MKTFIGIGEHTLPRLPYSYDALEPYIDAKTMELHHSKHHQGYVNGLNAAEKGLAEARAQGDYGKIATLERAIAFHGSCHANHSIFWTNMKPKGSAKPAPTGELLEQIKKDFGSFENMQAQFSAAATAVEGNGWGALVYQPTLGRLYTLGIMNHQNLSVIGGIPLLLLDVWEHAYYLNYQNRRAEYVQKWWNVVDFANVEERYTTATKATLLTATP